MPLQPTGHKASLRLARAWLAVSALSILLLSGCIFRSAEPLLFTSDRDGNRDVYTVDPDGGRLTRLTTDDANDYAPSWSPDRDRVLYLSQNGGGMSVMVMDADGSNQVKLAQHAVITSQSWSPDGEKVSYAVAAEDNKVELHVVDADGSNNRPVVFNREHDESHSWSQDGLWIAVASRDAGSPGIYTRNPLGVNQFRLTEAVDSAPIWSPKENELAFLSLEDGNLEIYVVNGEGNDRQRLTRNEARDYQASWSPDGKRLAFVSERDGNPEIYLVNVEDGEETRLTFNDFPAMQPVWRSNGKQIAFVSYHSGDGDIFVMDSDGEGQVRLTSNSSEDFMVSW